MDIHLLAYVYHWDRDTLWNMSNSERKLFAKMVSYQKLVEANAIKPKGSKKH